MSRIDSFSYVPVNNPTALKSQMAPESSASLQAAQVNVSQSQTSDMTVVTVEGDTVMLSLTKSADLSFATYNAQSHAGDSSATISGASTEVHRTTAFSITVDGDLNKEELKDIRSAIRTMQKAANDVRKGHEEKAVSRMAKLAGLDQLASIGADLEFNREVSVTQVSAQSDTTAGPESTETLAPTPAPISQPSSDSQLTEPSQTGVSAPVSTPVETSSTAASTVATATASTHISVLIQTQAAATSSNTPDASPSGLWWFPSQDLWNTLQPKKDSLAQAIPAPATETPVTA